jgi:hypothetical protein
MDTGGSDAIDRVQKLLGYIEQQLHYELHHHIQRCFLCS